MYTLAVLDQALKAMTKVVGVIPARYASTRLPAKPLVQIMGKSLIRRTFENAKRCHSLDSLVVATDNPQIYDHVLEFGGEAVMTSPDCPSGTDRIAEAVQNDSRLQGAAILVNIQGDEPILDPGIIHSVVQILKEDPSVPMSTAVMRMTSEEEANSTSVNKCVLDKNGFALYFSRTLIPGGKTAGFRDGIAYYKHVGIYGYRKDFLLTLARLPASPLQLAEDLEQLKALEHGYKIKAAIVEGCCIGVDTPEDIQKIERILCKQDTYL